MKVCSQCGVEKPLEDFYKYKRSKDGRCAYCIQCDKIAKAKYYQRTRERAIERAANWASDNPNKVKLAKREWKRRNPDSNRKYKIKRRALESVDHYTEREWLLLLEKFEHRCLACGTIEGLTADHVIPLTLGGSNRIDNIQPLCLYCNSKKGTKSTDYREI